MNLNLKYWKLDLWRWQVAPLQHFFGFILFKFYLLKYWKVDMWGWQVALWPKLFFSSSDFWNFAFSNDYIVEKLHKKGEKQMFVLGR